MDKMTHRAVAKPKPGRLPGLPSRGGSMFRGPGCRAPAITTAEYTEAAISGSVGYGSTRGRRVWKPATRQTWKSALRRPDFLNGFPPHPKGWRPIRKGPWSLRQVLECGGKAKPRHRFPICNSVPRAPSGGHRHTGGQSGVALRFPPHSKSSARFAALGARQREDGACLCAGGTPENSPTSRRWVRARNGLSPDRDGRRPGQPRCPPRLQPSLSGLMALRQSSPTLKRWAIIACPSGTRAARVLPITPCLSGTQEWRQRGPTKPSGPGGGERGKPRCGVPPLPIAASHAGRVNPSGWSPV